MNKTVNSFITTRFKWKRQSHCLPACHSFNYYIDNIHVSQPKSSSCLQSIFQYIKMQPEQENFIRGQLKLQDNIKLAAAELQLSEKINVRQEETEAYAFTAFLADLI